MISMWLGKFLLKIVPNSLLMDVSFHNFYNAITACYIGTTDLKLRRVNPRFLEIFNLKTADLKGMEICDLFKLIGLSEKEIQKFRTGLEKDGFVIIPEFKVSLGGEDRYFSLFSTYTKDILVTSLSGVQGQLIDRTERVKLRLESEKLATELAQKSKQIEEQNERLEALASKLAKYLSPQIYGSIFKGEKSVSISFERKKLTVFFSDIHNFTSTTESMDSEALANLLNHYLDSMSKIALKYGGTIDKFIGDAILIFFGDPESKGEKQDAINCIKMAIEMRQLMNLLRDEWFSQGIARPLHIRIGVNTGYCTVGNFGSEDRLEYTIIGTQVNIASRLETSAESDAILISHETYGLIHDEIYCEPVGYLSAKGVPHKIKTYKVIDLYENMGKVKEGISKEIEGFTLKLDINSIQEPEEVSLILKDAAKLLEQKR